MASRRWSSVRARGVAGAEVFGHHSRAVTGCILLPTTQFQPDRRTVRGPRSPQIVLSAQDNILSTISGGGTTVSGDIEARKFSISIAEVRKRYTAVKVELANSAAAFS